MGDIAPQYIFQDICKMSRSTRKPTLWNLRNVLTQLSLSSLCGLACVVCLRWSGSILYASSPQCWFSRGTAQICIRGLLILTLTTSSWSPYKRRQARCVTCSENHRSIFLNKQAFFGDWYVIQFKATLLWTANKSKCDTDRQGHNYTDGQTD